MHLRLGARLLSFLLLVSAAPALAQADDPRQLRSLAAGYKAQFICSSLWNGGKALPAIEADELTGIYPHIASIVPTLEAAIDPEARQVRVAFADGMPPRIAAWRPGLGCAALPVGAGPEAAAHLPALGHAPDPAAFASRPWPMGDAGAADRRAPPALAPVTERAFTDSYGGRTSAVLVVHRGRIVAEQYQPGHDRHTSQRTWSVAKSIAGTLIGHAVQHGWLRPSDSAGLAAWSRPGDPRAAITIEHLMRMASGLTSDTAGNRTDLVYMGGMAVHERSPHWPLLHRPGTRFRYANNDTLLAMLAVTERLPEPDRLEFPTRFFHRIGMTRTIAETDWRGDFILSSQVWTTARDLARLGLLYLGDGLWNGERLLPPGWREFVTSTSGPQPEGAFGYGATFWLLNQSDGVPQDAFAAFGNRGQYLVIIPSLDLVIVRRGYDRPGAGFDIAAFTRDVVGAIGTRRAR